MLGKELGRDSQDVGKGMAWLRSIHAWEGRTTEKRKWRREGKKNSEGQRGEREGGREGRNVEREAHKETAPVSNHSVWT